MEEGSVQREERAGMDLMQHLFLSYLADRERENCAQDSVTWDAFRERLRQLVCDRTHRPWIDPVDVFRWATPMDVIRAARRIDTPEGPALWRALLESIETDPQIQGRKVSGVRCQVSAEQDINNRVPETSENDVLNLKPET
jgi:hypothetical protein